MAGAPTRTCVFRLTGADAALFALALATWSSVVFPVNTEMATWPSDGVPADWSAWRARWEYGHAARAVLQIGGLASLLLSVIIETPSEERLRAASRAS